VSVDRSSFPPGDDGDEVIETIQSLQDRVDDLEAENNRLTERLLDVEAENAELRRTIEQHANRLDDLETGTGGEPGAEPSGLTELERKARIPRDVRRDTLSASEFRATVIFNHWEEWSSKSQGREMITTKKTRSGKAAIKQLLSSEVGKSLDWRLVYRAMSMVGRLTGGDSENQHDGAFNFQEGLTPPDNTVDETYKALILAHPDRLAKHPQEWSS
jgi:hypothetical protein